MPGVGLVRGGLAVMEKRVVMCVDGQSLRNPAMVGLAGEPLDALGWLECVSGAEECRRAARGFGAIEEAWVVSCDDMEPINVAAAIKRDDPRKRVFVVSCGQNGSMASRVANAGIDGLWSESQFLRRFSQVKNACAGMQAPLGADARPSETPPSKALSGTQTHAGGQRGAVGVFDGSSLPETSALHAPALPVRPAVAGARSAAVIAVASGSGGCGKSTIAAMAAALTSKAGLSTIAVDADLQFGDLHYLLGVKEPLRIEEALAEPARLGRLAEEARKGVALVAAPRRLEMSEEVAPGLGPLLAQVSSMCDVAMVNTGAFWSDAQATVFEAADAVLLLMDSRPSSLRATTHAVELCARMGIATTSFTFVVNRHDRSRLLSAVDVSCSLRGASAIELPDGGRDVDELLGQGYVSELLESRNPLVEAIRGMLGSVLPAERRDALANVKAESARRRTSFFGRGKDR